MDAIIAGLITGALAIAGQVYLRVLHRRETSEDAAVLVASELREGADYVERLLADGQVVLVHHSDITKASVRAWDEHRHSLVGLQRDADVLWRDLERAYSILRHINANGSFNDDHVARLRDAAARLERHVGRAMPGTTTTT